MIESFIIGKLPSIGTARLFKEVECRWRGRKIQITREKLETGKTRKCCGR